MKKKLIIIKNNYEKENSQLRSNYRHLELKYEKDIEEYKKKLDKFINKEVSSC